jgi:hypothetical protein
MHLEDMMTYFTWQNYLTMIEDANIVDGTIRLNPRVPKAHEGSLKPFFGPRKQI